MSSVWRAPFPPMPSQNADCWSLQVFILFYLFRTVLSNKLRKLKGGGGGGKIVCNYRLSCRCFFFAVIFKNHARETGISIPGYKSSLVFLYLERVRAALLSRTNYYCNETYTPSKNIWLLCALGVNTNWHYGLNARVSSDRPYVMY